MINLFKLDKELKVALDVRIHFDRENSEQNFPTSENQENANTVSTYEVDYYLLCRMIKHLTATAYEEEGFRERAVYVTGIKVGENTYVLTELLEMEMEEATPIRAFVSAREAGDVLIRLHNHGMIPVAMGHSHPGEGGPDTVVPSVTDHVCFRRLEQAGSKAIGIIVSRDGYVRFFSATRDFKIKTHGNKIHKVETHEHTYKVEL